MRVNDQTRRKLAEHIEEVASGYNIWIGYNHIARKPRLWRDGYNRRHMSVRPIRGRVSYFQALYMIGLTRPYQSRRRLEREAIAWQWAIDNAIVMPTPSVWLHIAKHLNALCKRAAWWQSMVLPDKDHMFWKLLKEAEEKGDYIDTWGMGTQKGIE